MRCRGVGPIPCDLMVCGEGPGWEEDKAGQPLVGKTGREFDRFMDGSNLPTRKEVWLTNLYKFYGGKEYEWTEEDLARDAPALEGELLEVAPKVIITLGRHATRYFLGDVDMDDVQGLPWYFPRDYTQQPDGTYDLQPDARIIFPIVHPAAGFHNPEMSPFVVSGFHELSRFLGGQIAPRILFNDAYPEPDYEEIIEPEQINLDPSRPIHIDSEGSPRAPWSVQYSQVDGEARLIRADNFACLREFARQLRGGGHHGRPDGHPLRIVYHNALHDLSVLRAMEIETVDLPFDDTMVMAYLLQIEPKGLKPLALRLANMKMSNYDEVLGDAGNRLASTYLTWLWDSEQFAYKARQQEKFDEINATPLTDKSGRPKRDKSGAIKYRRTTVMPTVPKTPLHRAVERCLSSKRPRGLWFDQVEDILVSGYRRMGFMPEATLDHVESAVAIHYGCRDADATTRIRPTLSDRVDDLGLRRVYGLEIGTYPLIDRMQQAGIKPDLAHFAALSPKLEAEYQIIQARLAAATGKPDFNANSGDQVAAHLFDTMGIEPIGSKKTDSGRASTNDKVLEGIEKAYPELAIVQDIRAYREYYKLKNTFVDVIPTLIKGFPWDGRIHPAFRTTSVITGRLAASMPFGFPKFNLLALPKHGKFANDFRRGFVPEPEHVLAEWDLSQIELRILAHLSQDPTMLAIFRGERRNPDGSMIDLHAALAERIFGVKPKDQDKSKHRLPAKAINFGLPMGMTYKGLTVELRKNGVMVDEDDAQRWIDETMGLYKGVPIYQQEMIAEARRHGYITCMSGRRRYIGGIRSRDERVREEAQRFSFSTPIQEGAQTVMKTNEAVLYKDILVPYWRQGIWIEPLAQVHDALTLECEDEGLARAVHPMMVACMTESFKDLSVPIETSGDFGYNWGAPVKDKTGKIVDNFEGMKEF